VFESFVKFGRNKGEFRLSFNQPRLMFEKFFHSRGVNSLEVGNIHRLEPNPKDDVDALEVHG